MKFIAAVVERQRWLKKAVRLLLGGLLSMVLLGCASRSPSVQLLALPDLPSGDQVRPLSGALSEVAPPAIFLDLADLMADAQPQVAIALPKPDQVIEETSLSARLTLSGLSIYKDEETGLGPHLQVILDNQPAQSLYSLDDPLAFSDLSPGSHTLRVFAVRPWGESFKNVAAFAQTTFHVFAKTGENAPDLSQPLLTYSEPQGTYGAEPVLLDFYLTNAPLHMIAQESSEDDVVDWQIRCMVNGQSFLFEQWQPIYLKGFKPGQNWVQLTLVDKQGNPIDNAFNSTVRLVNYDPEQQNSLAKIVRGELPLKQIGQIANPDYEPPAKPVAPLEPEPVDIIESELPLEEQPTTAAEPEEALPAEPAADKTEDLPESPSLESELEYPADLRETEEEPLDQLFDELEPSEMPAEETPDDFSDFESAADGSIESSEKLEEAEEPSASLERLAAERPPVAFPASELAPPTVIPDTLTRPSADDTSAVVAPNLSDRLDTNSLDASVVDEASEPAPP